VPRILTELPETLDETYERILRGIHKTKQRHARRLLQCLTVAARPLAVEELAEVLAIDFDAAGGIPKLNENFRWADQEHAVLSACSSLVAIVEDQGSRRVQFSHFSVKEFLTSDRLAASTMDVLRGHYIRLEPAHTIMAQACLSVLLRLDHYMDKETILSYPLAKYAGKFFADHTGFGDVLPRISDGLDDLLDPDKPHFNTWLWLRNGDWVSMSYVWHSGPDSYLGETLSDQSNPEHLVPIYLPRIFPLYHVVAFGYTRLAQHLILKRPGDLDASDKYGITALHIAAHLPNAEVAHMLIERAAAINGRDNKGRTPLHFAMRDGWGGWDDDTPQSHNDLFRCVRLLLDRGASAEAQNNDGSTPLHVAASNMSREIVQLLIENITDIDLRNNDGQTTLHKASRRGRPDIIQLILNHNAEVNALDNTGSTPLHLAIPEGPEESLAISEAKLEAVQVLLKHGAKINVQNHMGQTALHRASQRGHLDIIQLILNHGADVDAPDNDGSTPLHLAISEGCVEIVQLLLKHGASVHTQNNWGETLFQAASAGGLQEITELLSMHVQRE
jgi:ankyrin repeat protein